MRRPVLFVAFLVFVFIAAPTYAQQPAPAPSPHLALLLDLVDRSAVSGFESEVREAVRSALPASVKPRIDEAGNLIVTFGTGTPHVLVCADMDEDGYFVSGITGEGYLRVHRVTTGVTNRLFEQMHYGQPIFVRTQAGKRVPGVFVTASTHLQRGRDQSATPKGLDDLWIDVGASSTGDVERLGIQMLDPVGLAWRDQRLAGSRLAGVAAQARAASVALVELVRRAAAAGPKVSGSLTVAWTAQGSFGERGMARLAQQVQADQVIVIARTPMGRDAANLKGGAGEIGAGVLVADSDAATIERAKQQGVAVQPVNSMPRAPNVWPAARTRVLAVPVLYAQTPVETVDARDIGSLTSLLCATVGVANADLPPVVPKSVTESILGPADTVISYLGPLIDRTAVSGAEGPVREVVLKQLPKWAKPQVDDHGNVTVSVGQGGKELAFVAHMDEIGYAITDILENGTASVVKRGGFFDYLWEAHPVFVQTARGVVPAVVAPRPNYLNAATATPRPEDIVLSFGTTSRAETQALGVAKGDTATIRKQLTQLAGSRWTARSMDDRCGVAALIAALNRIDPAKVPNRVTFAFVVGEETGLVGSGFVAEKLHPAAVFAVDTFVSSDSPVDPQRLALVPLGSGVVARAIDNSSITPPETVARIVSIGRKHQIPVVVSATSGGNDGSQFSKYGSIVAPLSWPGRYSHSPVEIMDVRDLEHLVGLVMALATEF